MIATGGAGSGSKSAGTSKTGSRIPSRSLTPRVDSSSRSSSSFAFPSSSPSSLLLLPRTAFGINLEIVFSTHVSYLHRFLTFQTRSDVEAVQPVLNGFVEEQYAGDEGMLFHNVTVSPGNLVPEQKEEQVNGGGGGAGGEDELRHRHVYTYDGSGTRFTVMLITTTIVEDEDEWPAWCQSVFAPLSSLCTDIASRAGNNDNKFFPCFRELRPAHSKKSY